SENIEVDAHNLSTRPGDGRAVARSLTVGAPVLLEMWHVRLYPIHLEAAVTTSALDLSLARLYFPRDAAGVLERGRASSTLEVALDARAGLRANVSGALEDVALVRRGGRAPRRGGATLAARARLRANVSGALEDVALVRRGERDPVVLVPKLTVELVDFQYQDE